MRHVLKGNELIAWIIYNDMRDAKHRKYDLDGHEVTIYKNGKKK